MRAEIEPARGRRLAGSSTATRSASIAPALDLQRPAAVPDPRRAVPSARRDHPPRRGGLGLRAARHGEGHPPPPVHRGHRHRRRGRQGHGRPDDAGPDPNRHGRQRHCGLGVDIAQMVGLRLPIVTHPLQALVTEPLKPFLDPVLVSATLHVYVNQTDRGELVIGSEIDPYASYSMRSTLPFLEASASHALDLLPSIAGVKVLRQWAGICDMTPDYSPIMGVHARRRVPRRRRLGHVRLQGCAGGRQADGRADRDGSRARADRAVRTRSVLHGQPDRGEGGSGGIALREVDGTEGRDDGRRTTRATGWPRAEAEIAERLAQDGIDYLLAQWVDIHGTPRCKGVPASATRPSSSAASRASPAPRRSAWARVPTATIWSACRTSRATRSCPWEEGVARVRARHRGRRPAVAVLLADRPQAALDRLAGIGYELNVGVEAEHMLVTRAADGSIAPVRPDRLRHARQALLRLQGPGREPRLPARPRPRTWRPWAGSRTRPTTRTPPRSSSSTGSTPTPSPPPTATRSSR